VASRLGNFSCTGIGGSTSSFSTVTRLRVCLFIGMINMVFLSRRFLVYHFSGWGWYSIVNFS